MHAKPKFTSIYSQNINQQWFDAELKVKYLLKELSGAWLCQNPILIGIMALKCQLLNCTNTCFIWTSKKLNGVLLSSEFQFPFYPFTVM